MSEITYTPLHIDVARYASDDFNPFHDKHKWQSIRGNRFGGPIVLGFQLSAFIVQTVRDTRRAAMVEDNLRYSTLQVRFVDAIRAGETLTVLVKPAADPTAADLGNRFVVKRSGRTAIIGALRDSDTQAPFPLLDPALVSALDGLPDRSFVPGGEWFLKRKFMLTSNAKNFLTAAGVDAFRYFDELEDRVVFPELYPASLLSSALLERGLKLKHDFIGRPMVYAQHQITTDRAVLARLRSNDRLNIVVSADRAGAAGLALPGAALHACAAYTARGELLFSAEITLVTLASLTSDARAESVV